MWLHFVRVCCSGWIGRVKVGWERLKVLLIINTFRFAFHIGLCWFACLPVNPISLIVHDTNTGIHTVHTHIQVTAHHYHRLNSSLSSPVTSQHKTSRKSGQNFTVNTKHLTLIWFINSIYISKCLHSDTRRQLHQIASQARLIESFATDLVICNEGKMR